MPIEGDLRTGTPVREEKNRSEGAMPTPKEEQDGPRANFSLRKQRLEVENEVAKTSMQPKARTSSLLSDATPPRYVNSCATKALRRALNTSQILAVEVPL